MSLWLQLELYGASLPGGCAGRRRVFGVQVGWIVLLPTVHYCQSKVDQKLIRHTYRMSRRKKGPAKRAAVDQVLDLFSLCCKALKKQRGQDTLLIYLLSGWITKAYRS